jgi:CBS domain-containing protein
VPQVALLYAAADAGHSMSSRTRDATAEAGLVLERAARLMTDHRISHLLVVRDELAIPVGVISSLDLAGVLAQ